jgi:hypothetical protein
MTQVKNKFLRFIYYLIWYQMSKYIFIVFMITIPFLSSSQEPEIPKTNQVSLLAKYDSIFITLNNYLID